MIKGKNDSTQRRTCLDSEETVLPVREEKVLPVSTKAASTQRKSWFHTNKKLLLLKKNFLPPKKLLALSLKKLNFQSKKSFFGGIERRLCNRILLTLHRKMLFKNFSKSKQFSTEAHFPLEEADNLSCRISFTSFRAIFVFGGNWFSVDWKWITLFHDSNSYFQEIVIVRRFINVKKMRFPWKEMHFDNATTS